MIPLGAPLERLLEWGTATDEPGSRVVTVEGCMLFTGSAVRHAVELMDGTIVQLVSPESIMVLWDGGAAAVPIQPDHVVWLSNPFRTRRVF